MSNQFPLYNVDMLFKSSLNVYIDTQQSHWSDEIVEAGGFGARGHWKGSAGDSERRKFWGSGFCLRRFFCFWPFFKEIQGFGWGGQRWEGLYAIWAAF